MIYRVHCPRTTKESHTKLLGYINLCDYNQNISTERLLCKELITAKIIEPNQVDPLRVRFIRTHINNEYSLIDITYNKEIFYIQGVIDSNPMNVNDALEKFKKYVSYVCPTTQITVNPYSQTNFSNSLHYSAYTNNCIPGDDRNQ
jgi:hypothetical protein